MQGQQGWRQTAARIVEEMFSGASQNDWDQLLDLRQAILSESDGKRMLGQFVQCRADLEGEQYLPFYRLRGLLCAHLQLEGHGPEELRKILRRNSTAEAFLRSKRCLLELV